MSEFVKVHCEIPNGVVLRIFEKVEGPFGTVSYLPGDTITLDGGDNLVDSVFFDKWTEANSDNYLLQAKFIERID